MAERYEELNFLESDIKEIEMLIVAKEFCQIELKNAGLSGNYENDEIQDLDKTEDEPINSF